MTAGAQTSCSDGGENKHDDEKTPTHVMHAHVVITNLITFSIMETWIRST